MQVLFSSGQNPEEYKEGGSGTYPGAPGRCPFKNCKTQKKLKKHGYYQRYIKTPMYSGKIRIRRYKCTVCGRTISMLPSFCIPGFQYGAEVIIKMLLESFIKNSIDKVVTEWGGSLLSMTSRNITYYRARLRRNRRYIQYVLNQISPEFIELNKIPGDNDWVKRMLVKTGHLHPHVFNAEFHKITGKSFMHPQNIVA